MVAGDVDRCGGYVGTVAGFTTQRLLAGCHLATAGAVSFARGVNDTPKIAALLLLAAPLGISGARPCCWSAGAWPWAGSSRRAASPGR